MTSWLARSSTTSALSAGVPTSSAHAGSPGRNRNRSAPASGWPEAMSRRPGLCAQTVRGGALRSSASAPPRASFSTPWRQIDRRDNPARPAPRSQSARPGREPQRHRWHADPGRSCRVAVRADRVKHHRVARARKLSLQQLGGHTPRAAGVVGILSSLQHRLRWGDVPTARDTRERQGSTAPGTAGRPQPPAVRPPPGAGPCGSRSPVLVEQDSEVGPGDAVPTNVIGQDEHAAALQLGQPTESRCWDLQVQLADRDQVGQYGPGGRPAAQ